MMRKHWPLWPMFKREEGLSNFDEELFGKSGKPRTHLTWAEKRRQNQQWTRPDSSTATAQLKTELTRELGDLNEQLEEQGGATRAQIELNRKRELELAQLHKDREDQ